MAAPPVWIHSEKRLAKLRHGMCQNLGCKNALVKRSWNLAARLMENLPFLPVEEEGRLGDPILRENFIQRVFVLLLW